MSDLRDMERKPPPEHPTPEMIEAGVRMHQTPRQGPPETLVHDIWQSMYDAALASPEKVTASPATHGTPELDEDAAKLIALGADPGPTLADFPPEHPTPEVR